MVPPISIAIGKTDAVKRIAAACDMPDVNPWSDTVSETLQRLLQLAGPSNSFDSKLVSASEVQNLQTLVFPAVSRRLTSPQHTAGRPECFPASGVENAFSPALTTLTIPQGVLWNFAESPVVFLADGTSIVREYSTKYSTLIHFYDANPTNAVANSTYIDGTVLVMADDVRPLNFCHWMVDWLPRLAVLGPRARRSDVYVLTVPLTAPFQLETLLMCGFERDRIIEMKNFEAFRARELLVTSDLNRSPHPAFKGAPWATSYLKSAIGLPSAVTHRTSKSDFPKKLYISRADATGRRNASEESLCLALGKAGYVKIVLSDLSLGEQVALFAGSTHVVAPHGAGLSHLVFLTQRAQVVEIFPVTYGTPAYYVLTAGLENQYASYVARNVISGSRTQLDDVMVDIANFELTCGHML